MYDGLQELINFVSRLLINNLSTTHGLLDDP